MTNPHKTFSLHDWLNYLLIQHQCCHDCGIDRLQPIIRYFGLNHFSPLIIVVTGTNGKGSCVKLLEYIYTSSNYRVAAYTSPHCFEFNERISMNTSPISDAAIVNAFMHIETARGNMALRYFEFITLAALYIFKHKPLDVILLEVGIGGRSDPVGLVNADLTILTTVGIDHAELLGNTREAIANEKIALFRAGYPAICSEPSPPLNVFKHANQLKTPLYFIHRDFEYAYNLKQHTWHWQMGDIEYHNLPLPKIKLQNAATVLAAVTLLRQRLPVHLSAIKKALKNARLTGRFEILEAPHRCILDVAHNAQAVEWLVKQLQQLDIKGKIFAVFAAFEGKDVSAMINCIKPFIAKWYICPLHGFKRPSAHQKIINTLKAQAVLACEFFPSVVEAFLNAGKHASKDDCVLVFGSFHTVVPIKMLHSHKRLYNNK